VRHVAIGVCVLVGVTGMPVGTVGMVTPATPFHLGAHNEPVVAVRVNGAGPFPFILDTGSTHSSIGSELVRTLGAPAVAKTTVSSSLGQHVRPVVNLEKLEVGPLAALQVLATEVSDDSLGNKKEVRGVLGQDVLSSLVYTLDFTARRVEWNAGVRPTSSHASTLRLRNAQGRFLVELPQNDSTLWLVPDSGAETLVLYERPNVPLPSLRHTGRLARLSTVTDQQAVETVRMNCLTVGDANLSDVPAVLVKHDEDDASLGDGLLPLAMFNRVTFDGPGRVLIVER
jgi:predicted aspartyl protease